ncbi:MAG: serine/threonine-protein kinase [Myxococcaceae bacterium]
MERLGKYQLVRKLATGGMAEVFLARAEGPMGFAKKLVVKRILPQYCEDPGFVSMFLGEAKLAAELNHPNVVQIFDFGEVDGRYFIAMELIDGPNLRVLNNAARAAGAAIGFEYCARLVASAAEGLHYAHDLKDGAGRPINLVHRDISPDNILVSRQGTVKVVDFGIAKANTSPNLTRSGVLKGKMAYMPPEQLGRKNLDRRVDVYALGVVLYELVTGSMPFDATSEVSIIQAVMSESPLERVSVRRGDVPRQLDDIIHKCLDKNRDYRYASCRELQVDLERFILTSGHPITTGELSELVSKLIPPFPSDTDIPAPPSNKATPAGDTGESEMGFDKTFQRDTSSPGHSKTDLSKAEVAARTGAGGGSRGALMALAGAIALAVLAVGVWFVVKKPADTGPGINVVEAPDAGQAAIHVPPPVEIKDASVAVVEPPVVADAGAAVPVAVADAGSAEPHHVVTPTAQHAMVEFRIRPFAIVYVDGKQIGETPFDPVKLSAGKHKIRLVNAKLSKDIAVDFVVKPHDENVFKYNLNE